MNNFKPTHVLKKGSFWLSVHNGTEPSIFESTKEEFVELIGEDIDNCAVKIKDGSLYLVVKSEIKPIEVK